MFTGRFVYKRMPVDVLINSAILGDSCKIKCVNI